MHWLKKGVFGMFFTLFLFIAMMLLEAVEANPFDPIFITMGGFILIFLMGFFETNIVTL